MTNDEQDQLPPEPEDTGVDEIQEAGDGDDTTALTVSGSSGIGQLPLTDTMEDFLDSGIRGQAAMALLSAHIQRFERDLEATRRELKKERHQRQKVESALAEEKERTAVLEERLANEKESNTLRRVMVTLGGILGGAGLPQLASGLTGSALAASIVGGLLLLGGWFLPRRRREEVA